MWPTFWSPDVVYQILHVLQLLFFEGLWHQCIPKVTSYSTEHVVTDFKPPRGTLRMMDSWTIQAGRDRTVNVVLLTTSKLRLTVTLLQIQTDKKEDFFFVFRHKWTHRVPVKDQAVPLHIVPLLHAKIPQGIGTFWIMTATKMKLDHQNHNKNLEKDVAIPTFLKSNWLRLGFETRQDTWDNNDTALWSTANVIIGCLFWGNRLKIPCCSAFLHLVPLTTGSTLVFPLLKEILSYSYSVFHVCVCVCVCIFVSPQKLFHWKKNSFLQSFKYKKLAKYPVSYLYFLTVLNC